MIRPPPRSTLFPSTPLFRSIIFSTNLDPADLVDEAFLRRIRYKIGIEAPTVAQYEEIFKRMCARKNIEYRAESMSQILRSEEHTSELQSQSNLVCRLLLEKK